ncbi:zinc-binding protein A33-like [Scleropages formosus]|uniref:zinc-binding protein A33-like n=1 Tax=Scleropages formosus TaxID=113540 RepID=UPI0010FA6FEB|nr:zinc-binding protein A33-like [Scleropages formosus]
MTSSGEAGLAMSLVSEVTCPLCSTLYDDPVRLDCEHNYCRKCIIKYWNEGETTDGDGDTKGYTCPLCCEIFPQFTLKSNKLLASIVGRVRDLGLQNFKSPIQESKKSSKNVLGQDGNTELGKGLCPVHGEPLKMFCVEEKMAICVVCAVSKEHRAHCLAPMEEILTQCEENFQAAVRHFDEKMGKIETICKKNEEEIQEIKNESLSLHAHIVRETDCLLQCVQRERERLCSELHDDTQRLLALKQKTSSDLLQQGEVLQQQVASLRRRVGQEVQDPSALIKDIQELTARLKTEPAALEDEAADRFDLGVYRGPLQYAVWKKLAEVIQPALCTLNFDPATANTFLSLSEDLTTAQYSYSPKDGLSIGEACFEFSPCVLASRGFSSGRHYWEVDVGDKSDWDLGVAEETAERAGWVVLCPENGYWTVGNKDARKVGVYLDYEAGQVSFYNAADMTPLFSYVGASFKETLYPFFYPSADSKAEPLKILNPRF